MTEKRELSLNNFTLLDEMKKKNAALRILPIINQIIEV